MEASACNFDQTPFFQNRLTVLHLRSFSCRYTVAHPCPTPCDDSPSHQMGIKLKFRFGRNGDADVCMVGAACTLMTAILMSGVLNFRITESRKSLFFPNGTTVRSLAEVVRCKVPFDQCQCSFLSKKTNRSTACVSDIETVLADVLPLLIYTLILYIIYEFFSFEGKHRCILNILFWFGALVIQAVIYIGTRDRSCAHLCISLILQFIGVPLYGFVVIRMSPENRERRAVPAQSRYPCPKLVTNKAPPEMTITLTVR